MLQSIHVNKNILNLVAGPMTFNPAASAVWSFSQHGNFHTTLNPSTPIVAIWVQLWSILCQTGLSH